MTLYPSVPRLEAALDGTPTAARCPCCEGPVFAPGWWCETCNVCVFPTMILDPDYEPDGDEEPDNDYG